MEERRRNKENEIKGKQSRNREGGMGGRKETE